MTSVVLERPRVVDAGQQTIPRPPLGAKRPPENPTRCNAPKRSLDYDNGWPCQKAAGWGTDHPGVGRCRTHGGSQPSHNLHALKVVAQDSLPTTESEHLGTRIPVDPSQALLDLVAEANGNVKFLGVLVRSLNTTESLSTMTPLQGEVIRAHVRLYGEWVDRLGKLAKQALDARVEEQRLRLREREGTAIISAMAAMIGALQLTPSQEKSAYAAAANSLRLSAGHPIKHIGQWSNEDLDKVNPDLAEAIAKMTLPDIIPFGDIIDVPQAAQTAEELKADVKAKTEAADKLPKTGTKTGAKK